MNILRIICRVTHSIHAEGLGATTRSLLKRLQVRWNERMFGIQTDGMIELTEFGIQNEAYRDYLPTDYRAFHEIMRKLAIDPHNHVFLDFGAGMGRAIILAATYPFQR